MRTTGGPPFFLSQLLRLLTAVPHVARVQFVHPVRTQLQVAAQLIAALLAPQQLIAHHGYALLELCVMEITAAAAKTLLEAQAVRELVALAQVLVPLAAALKLLEQTAQHAELPQAPAALLEPAPALLQTTTFA